MEIPTEMPGEGFINSWWPIIIAVSIGLFIGLRSFMRGQDCPSNAKITGKTVLITGANSGIGKEMARGLTRRGARVIIACRNEEQGKAAEAELRTATKTDRIVYMHLDLSSLKSVRKFVENFLKKEDRLDILINNAGIMCHPQEKSVDGVELHFATNYLGHFLLTQLLLEELKSSAPSRVINVTAPAYQIGEIHMDDINFENREYKPGDAFAQSKLSVMLASRHLSKLLEGTNVAMNVVYPGIANTDVYRHMPFKQNSFIRMSFSPFMHMLMKTAHSAAQTAIYCAVAKEEEGVSGKFYSDCQMKEPDKVALDEELGEKLYDFTLKLIEEKSHSE